MKESPNQCGYDLCSEVDTGVTNARLPLNDIEIARRVAVGEPACSSLRISCVFAIITRHAYDRMTSYSCLLCRFNRLRGHTTQRYGCRGASQFSTCRWSQRHSCGSCCDSIPTTRCLRTTWGADDQLRIDDEPLDK